MALSGSKGKSLPKRLSAQRVRELVAEAMTQSDEEVDLSSSDSEYELSNDGDSETEISRPSNDQSSTRSISPQPEPGPSGEGPSGQRPAKRARTTPPTTTRSTTTTTAVDDVKWRVVSTNLGLETTNNFRFLPKCEPGMNANLDEASTPLTCFKTLLTDEICDDLIIAINDYAKIQVQKNTPARRRSIYASWVPITNYELIKFIGVVQAMGIDKRPAIRDYFSPKRPSLYTPWFHQMFTRERFESIYHTMLHVCEPDAVGKNKIEPFLDDLVSSSFQAAYTPFQEVSIDEMIVGWKGRWKYKQYNAAKPHHIKSFGLVDSPSGYVVNLMTYFGSETSYDPDIDENSGNAIKIIDTLLKPIGQGYHIFADRWYTTTALVKHLSKSKHYYTGTVQKNRVGLPQEIRKNQLKLIHMESRFWLEENNTMMCVAWRDKKANKRVIVMSTKAEVVSVVDKVKEKPGVIHSYNFNGGLLRTPV